MLDAALGMILIVIGVVLITSSYANVPKPTQIGLLSDDLLNFLSKTKIRDLNDPYAGIGGELWKQGLITDPDNSLLQQVGEFYSKSNITLAGKFIQNVSMGVMPQQFIYEVWMDGVTLYPQNKTPQHTSSRNSTGILLTSKKITFGIINKTTGNLWGPYKAEVFVWEK